MNIQDCIPNPQAHACPACAIARVRGGVPCHVQTRREQTQYRGTPHSEATRNGNAGPLLSWAAKSYGTRGD